MLCYYYLFSQADLFLTYFLSFSYFSLASSLLKVLKTELFKQ